MKMDVTSLVELNLLEYRPARFSFTTRLGVLFTIIHIKFTILIIRYLLTRLVKLYYLILTTTKTMHVNEYPITCIRLNYIDKRNHQNPIPTSLPTCWLDFNSTLIKHVKEYPTMHCYGISRHTRSLIAYKILFLYMVIPEEIEFEIWWFWFSPSPPVLLRLYQSGPEHRPDCRQQ